MIKEITFCVKHLHTICFDAIARRLQMPAVRNYYSKADNFSFSQSILSSDLADSIETDFTKGIIS